MKTNTFVLCIGMAGVLPLATSCGRTETAPPTPPEAQSVPAAPKVEPTPVKAVATPEPKPAVPTAAPVTPAPTPTAQPAAAAPAPPAPPAAAAIATPVKPAEKTNEAAAAAPAATGLAALSQDQMVKGLQDALGKGLQQAIAKLGRADGFLTNANVKIPMPEKMQKVESTLRALKQDKLANDFVATMNHAAEQAVPEAGAVFGEALKKMTIEDAKGILTGPNDAATQYFQRTTQTNLYAKFYPIVQKATANTGVTAAYKKVMEKANVTKSLGSLGDTLGGALLDKGTVDLDAYVSQKAMDGLFKMVAEEEKQIRQNPAARTTDLLQKVFGAFGK